jgi:hypothetical protein
MRIVLTWAIFIILMSVSEDLDQPHYLLFSCFMFYFTYINNQVKPRIMTIKWTIIFLITPNLIFWYIGFVYNDFLCLNPISYEMFMSILFTYFYLMIYLFFFDQIKTEKHISFLNLQTLNISKN